MLLDERDLKILSTLSSEGRISKAALAERIGLSATPCWERLRKLELAGFIHSYGARVNLNRLGPTVCIFTMIELDSHTAGAFQIFESAMAQRDAVLGCWALGGGYDYLLQVVTRDLDTYQTLIDEILAADIGLSRYFTYVVTKNVKSPDTLPMNLLRTLADGR